MAYKNEIKEKIQIILKEEPQNYTYISITVVNEFSRILQLSKSSGLSLRHTTYSILEGLDEALQDHTAQKEKIFQAVTKAMAEVAYNSAKKEIQKIKSLPLDKKNIAEKIESERAHLEDIAEGFKEYVLENGYHLLAQSVEKVQNAADNIGADLHLHNS